MTPNLKIRNNLFSILIFFITPNLCSAQKIGLSELMNAAQCDSIECLNKFIDDYELHLDTVDTKYFYGKKVTAYFFTFSDSSNVKLKNQPKLMFSTFKTDVVQGTTISITVFDTIYYQAMLLNLKEKDFEGSAEQPIDIPQTEKGIDSKVKVSMQYKSQLFPDYLVKGDIVDFINPEGKSQTGYYFQVMRFHFK